MQVNIFAVSISLGLTLFATFVYLQGNPLRNVIFVNEFITRNASVTSSIVSPGDGHHVNHDTEGADHARVSNAQVLLNLMKDNTPSNVTNNFSGKEEANKDLPSGQNHGIISHKMILNPAGEFTEFDPGRWNLSMAFAGRMGNHMFQYAALISLAKELNMNVILDNSVDLLQYFDLGPKISEDIKVIREYQRYPGLSGLGSYENVTAKIPNASQNIMLCGPYESFKYFKGHDAHVRRDFKFLPDVMGKAESFLDKVRPGIRTNLEIVKVGIHVRRGDFLKPAFVKKGRTTVPGSYVRKAMDYMRSRFSNVIFIAASNDLAWVKKELHNTSDTIFSEDFDSGEDLALLSSCDHLIMSTGTFSWWAAWLTNGTVVYYKNYPKKGSPLAKGAHPDGYYPQHWVPLE